MPRRLFPLLMHAVRTVLLLHVCRLSAVSAQSFAVATDGTGQAWLVAGSNASLGAVLVTGVGVESVDIANSRSFSALVGSNAQWLARRCLPALDRRALARPQTLRVQKFNVGNVLTAASCGGLLGYGRSTDFVALAYGATGEQSKFVPIVRDNRGGPAQFDLSDVQMPTSLAVSAWECFTHAGKFWAVGAAASDSVESSPLLELNPSTGRWVTSTVTVGFKRTETRAWTFIETSEGAFLGQATTSTTTQNTIFMWSEVNKQWLATNHPSSLQPGIKFVLFEDSSITYAVLILSNSDGQVWRWSGAVWEFVGTLPVGPDVTEVSLQNCAAAADKHRLCIFALRQTTNDIAVFAWDGSTFFSLPTAAAQLIPAGGDTRNLVSWRDASHLFLAVASYQAPSTIALWRGDAENTTIDQAWVVLGRTAAYRATSLLHFSPGLGGNYLAMFTDGGESSWLFRLS